MGTPEHSDVTRPFSLSGRVVVTQTSLWLLFQKVVGGRRSLAYRTCGLSAQHAWCSNRGDGEITHKHHSCGTLLCTGNVPGASVRSWCSRGRSAGATYTPPRNKAAAAIIKSELGLRQSSWFTEGRWGGGQPQ